MASRSAHAPGELSVEDDIDVALLQNTQAYLACLSRRRIPSPSLRQAWEQFYRTYDPVIRRFAAARGLHAADLGDCIQEVWVAIIGHLGQFQYAPKRGRFASWLYTLVQSKVIDLVRRRTRHPLENLTAKKAAALSSPLADPAAGSDGYWEPILFQRALDQLRRQVPPRSYRTLYLRLVEGWTTGEIATDLGLTPAQVRLIHFRTKQKLRDLVELSTGTCVVRGAAEPSAHVLARLSRATSKNP